MNAALKASFAALAAAALVAGGSQFTAPALRAEDATALSSGGSQFTATAPAKRTVLMVDENGELNSTNAVSTVADLAAAATSALVAEAKADAAASATDKGTNMIAGVAAAIASSELVVYVRGRVSSFEAGVLFGPDDKIDIYDFKVSNNADGTITAKTWWYSTVPIGSSEAYLKWADSLTTGTFTDVAADSNESIGSQTVGSNTYQNAYLLTKTFDALPQSFFRVGLEPDAPSGDGLTLEIGGVTGGYTGTIQAGETLVVSNGVVIGKGAQ